MSIYDDRALRVVIDCGLDPHALMTPAHHGLVEAILSDSEVEVEDGIDTVEDYIDDLCESWADSCSDMDAGDLESFARRVYLLGFRAAATLASWTSPPDVVARSQMLLKRTSQLNEHTAFRAQLADDEREAVANG